MAADLIEVAAMAYAADRLAPRPRDRYIRGGSDWGRQIWLQVPVRDPGAWSGVAERISGFLGWLTDDDWELEFSTLPPGAGPLDDPRIFLFETVPDGRVPALFSGGLDSALGLARDLQDGDAIAISIYTNQRMQAVQQRLVRVLQRETGFKSAHLQYRSCLREKQVESSQRTRGFLFLATGIASAWGVGQHRLRVFENGIGAVNLPYLRSQRGAQAARSMHPRTLSLAEGLASALSGRPFRIEAPFLLITKAEALRAVPDLRDSVIADTVSCDTGFASRTPDGDHCGSCTSCVLRRQALLAAARADADAATRYRTLPPSVTGPLGAMIWQVERLRDALTERDPWQGLVSEFPPILDVGHLAPAEWIRLYRTYVQEWEAVEPQLGLWPNDRSAA
jgi:7-cyano-7-deazaguanine synthase in queuosine biosynthesis